MNNNNLNRKPGDKTPDKIDAISTIEQEFERDKEEIIKPTNLFVNGVKLLFKYLFDLIGYLK